MAGATTAAGAAAVTKKKSQPAKLPRSKNLLIVGLGNPGKDYTMTRHNAGFLVVDELAKRMGVDFKLRSAFQGEYGSTTFQGKSIGLLKPTTYMNNSGQSLRKVWVRRRHPFVGLNGFFISFPSTFPFSRAATGVGLLQVAPVLGASSGGRGGLGDGADSSPPDRLGGGAQRPQKYRGAPQIERLQSFADRRWGR